MNLNKLYLINEEEYKPIYRFPVGSHIDWFTSDKWNSLIAKNRVPQIVTPEDCNSHVIIAKIKNSN